MAEFYDSKRRTNVNQFDRYKNCKILIDKETGEVLLETREISDVLLSSEDKYHTVEPHEECRLDLISYKYYGNPLLWWVIAQANDIYNPLIGPLSNSVLRIPSLPRMYDYKGILL